MWGFIYFLILNSHIESGLLVQFWRHSIPQTYERHDLVKVYHFRPVVILLDSKCIKCEFRFSPHGGSHIPKLGPVDQHFSKSSRYPCLQVSGSARESSVCGRRVRPPCCPLFTPAPPSRSSCKWCTMTDRYPYLAWCVVCMWLIGGAAALTCRFAWSTGTSTGI